MRTNHDAHSIAPVKDAVSIKILEMQLRDRKWPSRRHHNELCTVPRREVRGERVRAAARSIGAALIELPVLEADRRSREGNSEMG